MVATGFLTEENKKKPNAASSESETVKPGPITKTVSENARLGVYSTGGGGDDLKLRDQSSFMLISDIDDPRSYSKWGTQSWRRPSYMPITIILTFLVVLLPVVHDASADSSLSDDSDRTCMDSCRISLVESIPIGLNYDNNSVIHKSTYLTWMELIESAETTIEIASFYWTMTRQDIYSHDSANEGEDVFKALLEAGRDRNVTISIAQNIPSLISSNINTEYLAKKAKAEVRNLNFTAILGGGVLHTKFWLVDRTHVYVGSANMDWRALTQVKELGLVAFNCSCLADDLGKIFDAYWQLGKDGRIPTTWPQSLSTKINVDNPINFTLNNNNYRSFIVSSPPSLSTQGRTNDLDGILHCIDKAEKFIYISVMDYCPLILFTPKVKYWPQIDNALRAASINRKVNVRLLVSYWKHSRTSQDYFLRSLADLTNSYKNVKIEVKRFIVPTNQDLDKIPYSRVNHNKYMVTDTAAYIGTSNWSGDYFINSAGVGMIFEDAGPENNNSIREQLEAVFNRDWNSAYAHPLNSTCSSS